MKELSVLGHARLRPFLPLGTSHILPSTFVDSKLRPRKVMGISHPARLPHKEIRFGEGGAGAKGPIKHNHDAIHQAEDFKLKSSVWWLRSIFICP